MSLLLSLSCSRRQSQQEQRILLLPFENQTPKSTLDWAANVSSAVLQYDLNGAPHLATFAGDSIRSVPNSQANQVLQGYFALTRDKLSVHATLEDPASRATVRTIVREGPAAEGILPLLDGVAKELNGAAHPFCTQDQAALQSYGEALGLTDPMARSRLLQAAVGQDPKFSAASIALAEILLGLGDRAQATQAASTGAVSAKNPLDRAQLEYLSATATDNLAGREAALTSLVRQTPANTQALNLLAQFHTVERKYKETIQDYQALTRLEPQNGTALNLLGYAYAYDHDLDNARKTLLKYREVMGPADWNPSDSLGEVHFLFGDFAAAERYFREAHQKNPAASAGRELLKAAQAHLMTGDIAGADRVFQLYVIAHKAAPQDSLEFARGQWEFTSGRRKQALVRLEKLLATERGDSAALVASQLAIWHLQTGDRPGATAFARQAATLATAPNVRNIAAICQFLVARAPTASAFPLMNGMALVLARQFAAAVTPLEKAYSETPPANDGEVRTSLAWAYSESGQPAKAKPLVELFPLLFPSPDTIFTTLAFPRFLALRGAILHSSQMNELFIKLSGDLPDRF